MSASIGSNNFPTDGLFTLLDASVNTVSTPLSEVEVLVVAGGGGGGMDMGGGGGGGGVLYSSAFPVRPGVAIPVTVGAGGAGAPAAGTNGQPSSHQYTIRAGQGGNSIFGTLTAIGGGYGASSVWSFTPDFGQAGSGGSGGGASGYSDGTGNDSYGGNDWSNGKRAGTGGRGGSGTPGQGFDGGGGSGQYHSGGGGGAGEAGGEGTYDGAAKGGDGLPYNILGTTYYWGGGGGGAGYTTRGGNGGLGGGGGGAVGSTFGGAGYNNGLPGGGGGTFSWANTPGGNAGANTGGGGGGGAHYNSNNKGGDGGSGIVIVRYPGPQKATGGAISNVGGNTIHIFTGGSDNFTPLTSASLLSTCYGIEDIIGNNSVRGINSPTYDSSDGGGSVVMNGTNQYFRLDSPNYPNTNGDKTILVWVKPDSGTSANTYTGVFSIGGRTCGGSDRSDSTLLSISSGTIYYVSSAYWCNDYVPNSTAVIKKDAWNLIGMIVRTRPGINNATLIAGNTDGFNYITGSSSANSKTIDVDASVMQIGATDIGGRLLKGKIGMVLMYDKELDISTIQSIFNNTKSRFGL